MICGAKVNNSKARPVHTLYLDNQIGFQPDVDGILPFIEYLASFGQQSIIFSIKSWQWSIFKPGTSLTATLQI